MPSLVIFSDTASAGAFRVLGEGDKIAAPRAIVYCRDYAGLPYGIEVRKPNWQPAFGAASAVLGSSATAGHGNHLPATPPRQLLSITSIGIGYPCSSAPCRRSKPASELTKTGVIGLLGTAGNHPATLLSGPDSPPILPPEQAIASSAPLPNSYTPQRQACGVKKLDFTYYFRTHVRALLNQTGGDRN